MSTLEDIAMRESPVMQRIRRENEASSFAEKFLDTYYGTTATKVAVEPTDEVTITAFKHQPPDAAWLAALQQQMDWTIAECAARVNRLLLCEVSPADLVIAKHVEDRCECGSGSNVRSGAHSDWCRLWIAP